jgi:hypothetical protein
MKGAISSTQYDTMGFKKTTLHYGSSLCDNRYVC